MKNLFPLLLVLAIATLGLQAAEKSTQNLDPDSNKWKVASVKWVIDHQNDLKKDDKFVALVGKVTKKHNADTYFFSDDTGTIKLDSDIELPVGEDIVVRGEIDQAFLHFGPLEVNVQSWRHVRKKGEYLK